MNQVRFGPAGHCDQSYADGAKTTEQLIVYLGAKGLSAFEYQCGRGVRLAEAKARKFRKLAQEQGISLSVHAPYYISLASAEEKKRENSVEYILQSARAVDWLGGARIVVHPGGLGGLSREKATALAGETLRRAVEKLEENGLEHVHICLETMGKINQLGTLEEVLELCRLDERMLPCVDFGHLNARTHGSLQTRADFAAVLDAIRDRLGEGRMRAMHIHFSKIEFSAGGEVRHLTFEDQQFGPDYRLLMEELAQREMACTVICESAGTQTADSLEMRRYYQSVRKNCS